MAGARQQPPRHRHLGDVEVEVGQGYQHGRDHRTLLAAAIRFAAETTSQRSRTRSPSAGGTAGCVIGRRPGTVAAVTELPADAAAFPELDDDQMAVVLELGERRWVHAGEVLFSPSDDHYDWIVILSGSVEVLGPNEQLITRHGPRRFLGEVNLVTRQRPYLSTALSSQARSSSSRPTSSGRRC